MSSIKQNIDSHDRIAKVYDLKHTEIYNAYEQRRLENVIGDLLGILNMPNPKILDYGAGTGNLTMKFLSKGCRVTACDVSEKSLRILEKKGNQNPRLSTTLIDGKKLPFPDHSFDAVASYSVLHHIPDYFGALGEMVRVCKPGGIIYIDHEANASRWNPTPALKEWMEHTRQTRMEHINKLLRTGELFTFAFAITVWMKLFVDPRYEREGDIHVWHDDHLEWKEIFEFFESKNCEITRDIDYLMYMPKGDSLYDSYKDICTDTKYVFIRKTDKSS